MKYFVCFIFFLCVVFCSCAQGSSEVVNFFAGEDTACPVLVEVSCKDDSTVILTFNEEVEPFASSFAPYEAKAEGCNILVKLGRSLAAGECVSLNARVKDKTGNSTGFTIPIWGFNSNAPSVIINELTVSSSEKSPKRTELFVQKSGNMAGLCLYCGSPADWDDRYVFPSMAVNANSYVVVWWTDEETFSNLVQSQDNVINVCASPVSGGPASSNGVETLTFSPASGARILDCVIYSNQDAQAFNGFGKSSVLDRAQYCWDKKAWQGKDVSSAYAVSSKKSTATRSICRKLDSKDTNSAADWYVTVTGGQTFGGPNISDPF